LEKLIKHINGDRVIWAVVLVLSIISLLVVYSSTSSLAYKYQKGDTEYYLIKHAIILVVGFAIIYVVHNIKYTLFSRILQIALFISAPLLLATLIGGVSINQGTRWLAVPGTSLTFQTSDFAKIALIGYLARVIALNQNNIKDLKTGFLPLIIPVLIICGLILPANLSTAAVLFVCSMVMLFVGGVNFKYILSLAGIGIVCLSVFVLVVMNSSNTGRVGTWKKRIESFSGAGDAKSNYQPELAKIAIATGGVVGKGPGKSTQRNFLPQSYSDFIYAIIIEEYGLVLGVVIILLYLILFLRGIRIATKCPKNFGAMLAFGCSFILVFQGLINMAVAVNLFPVTGQPLPMISMGGTSTWFTCITIGIILSVSRSISNKEEDELKEVAHA
jgi:cell division protein FtsW